MYQFTTLAIQSWILYSLSISLIFSRLILRRKTLGCCKKLQADDWLMVLILLPYTTSIVLANQVGTAQSAAQRKSRYVLEDMQIITTWLVRACLLVLYWRIFPVKSSFSKRRTLQCVSAFCCVSFLIVLVSLMLWCQPTEAYWNISINNPQCTSYHKHTAVVLSFDVPNTLLIMILPIPFIPTPRRLLLAILLILSTLILITSIISRVSILLHPGRPTYLAWYTTESTLSIIFANLPFLTSLVVTAAPARIRHFSNQLASSQWPRSRRGSWDNASMPQLRTTRFNSTATTVVELMSPTDLEKGQNVGSPRERGWSEGETSRDGAGGEKRVERDAGGELKDALLHAQEAKHAESRDARNSATDGHRPVAGNCTQLSVPVTVHEKGEGQVPKTRLSGGLAEMGELSLQDTTQGWPIYWR